MSIFNKFIALVLFLVLISCDVDGDPMGDALLSAAKQGDNKSMQAALDGGADINYVNPNFLSTQKTACSKAAEHGQMEALQWLVEKGADWHKPTSGGENPITLAAAKNHFNIVYYLIEKGEDVNYKESNYGMTAFLSAANNGNIEAMQKLISLGADINVVNNEKHKAIEVAIKRKQADAVDFLLGKGQKPVEGFVLLAQFQQDQRVGDNTRRIVESLLRAGLDINQQDGSGHTALHIASMWGNDAFMEYLVEKGADGSIKNSNGSSVNDVYRHYLEEEKNENEL